MASLARPPECIMFVHGKESGWKQTSLWWCCLSSTQSSHVTRAVAITLNTGCVMEQSRHFSHAFSVHCHVMEQSRHFSHAFFVHCHVMEQIRHFSHAFFVHCHVMKQRRHFPYAFFVHCQAVYENNTIHWHFLAKTSGRMANCYQDICQVVRKMLTFQSWPHWTILPKGCPRINWKISATFTDVCAKLLHVYHFKLPPPPWHLETETRQQHPQMEMGLIFQYSSQI